MKAEIAKWCARRIWLLALAFIFAWALYDVRSTILFRAEHAHRDHHAPSSERDTTSELLPLASSHDDHDEGRTAKHAVRTVSHKATSIADSFPVLAEFGQEHDWRSRSEKLNQQYSIVAVFFAGLEGTGHHFWEEFLKQYCNHKAPSSSQAACVSLSDKMFKKARSIFKRCAPKFDDSLNTSTYQVKEAKLLQIQNHCYQREQTQIMVAELAESILSRVESSVPVTQPAKPSQTHVFVFMNAFGNTQMWSYPNGKTFNEGRGWNPDASLLAEIAARLGFGFRVLWLQRSPASLLASTARRNFAEKKSRTRGRSDLESSALQFGLEGSQLESALRLVDYIGVLTHSQRTIVSQMQAIARRQGQIIAAWHHLISCRCEEVAPSIGKFLFGTSDAQQASSHWLENWTATFHRTARCSETAAALLSDVDAHEHSLQIYLKTLPASVCSTCLVVCVHRH